MLVLIGKFAIAFGLIFWLVQSGKIDFSILLDSLDHKKEWALCLAIMIFNTLIITIRWKRILEIQSKVKFDYLSTLKMTWIGNLFNTILPGLVSGDFIKLIYAKKHDPSLSKTFLVTSVFMDRILGLFALLIVLGISTAFFYNDLIQMSPEIRGIMRINFLIFIGMILFLLTLFLPSKLQNKILVFIDRLPLVGSFASKTFIQFWSIGKNKKNIFFLIFISMITQSCSMTAFWILIKPFIAYAPDIAHTVSLFQAFSVIPLGFVAVAIPITPSGLGVGHAVFNTLFSYIGITNGASLFNFQFIANITVNLMGIVPYIANKEKHTKEELEDFEDSNLENEVNASK